MAGKVCNPEESGLLGFMKRWTFPKEIRKKDKHADMMLRYIRNELQLLHLAAACSKIARTSVKVGRTILLPLLLLRLYRSKLSTNHLFVTSFFGISQNMLLSYSFYTTVVNNGLCEPYLLLSWCPVWDLFCCKVFRKWQSTQEVLKDTRLRLVFSPTLILYSTASCVLYNRTKHSPSFSTCQIQTRFLSNQRACVCRTV